MVVLLLTTRAAAPVVVIVPARLKPLLPAMVTRPLIVGELFKVKFAALARSAPPLSVVFGVKALLEPTPRLPLSRLTVVAELLLLPDRIRAPVVLLPVRFSVPVPAIVPEMMAGAVFA